MSQLRPGFEVEVEVEVEVEESIQHQIATLTAYYGLEEAVLRPILERTAEPRRVPDSIQVVVVYKPSLRAALAHLRPDQALPLFEADNLSNLAWSESFTRYLHTPIPLYTLRQLTDAVGLFVEHLDENRGNILGVPLDAPFAPSPWLSQYTRLIYPRNEGDDDFYDLWDGILTNDDWEHLTTRRETLLDLKTDVLRELHNGLLADETCDDLVNRCISAILASMSPDELQSWIRIDRLTTRYDITTGMALTTGKRYVSGGLSDVLEIIGHCAEETDVGIYAATASALGDLRGWDHGHLCLRATNYYDAVAQGFAEQIDCACDEFRRLRERYSDFWDNYRRTLVNNLQIGPYEPSLSVAAVTIPSVDYESFFLDMDAEPAPVFEHTPGSSPAASMDTTGG